MTDTIGTEADLWHVEVPSGEVLVVTLEQLDEAFNQGQVNGNTRVWQAGMECAVPLSELLGLDEDGEEQAPAPQHHAAIPPAPILTPQALSQAMYPQAPAQSAYPARSAHPQAQPAYPQGQASVAPRSAAPAAVSAWPPVVTRPNSVPPPASSPTAWQANVPSVRPMAYDLSDDIVPFAKPKRRGAVVFALMGLIAIGAGAFAFVNGNGAAAAAAAQAPAPVVVEPPRSHAYDPGNEPIHLREVAPLEITKPDAPPAAAKPTVAEAATLREAALKAANSKAPKSHPHAKAAPARKSQNTDTSSFKGTKSGSKYDPLNGAL
jgi:hypothetical protein